MADNNDDAIYANVRHPDMLGPILGQRVVDVTQHSAEEWAETHESRIYIHFENGYTVSFPITDAGWSIESP